MLTNRRAITVEWGDCDPAGIVYFPRYFEWFDACTTSLFERAGLKKATMLQAYGIAGIPLVDARAKFLMPSRYGDEVVVESAVVAWRRSSFDVHHRLFRPEGLAVEGFETRVWTARDPDRADRLKSRPIPTAVIERFA